VVADLFLGARVTVIGKAWRRQAAAEQELQSTTATRPRMSVESHAPWRWEEGKHGEGEASRGVGIPSHE
jgi:hypothetical protein